MLVAALSFVVWNGASPVAAAPLLTVTATSPVKPGPPDPSTMVALRTMRDEDIAGA